MKDLTYLEKKIIDRSASEEEVIKHLRRLQRNRNICFTIAILFILMALWSVYVILNEGFIWVIFSQTVIYSLSPAFWIWQARKYKEKINLLKEKQTQS